MAAATKPRVTSKYYTCPRMPVRCYKQKAGTMIFRGTMVMHINGVAEPARAGVADSVLCGIAQDNYDNLEGGTDKTWPDGMTFERVPFHMSSVSGVDYLTDAAIGTLVAVATDQELKSTIDTDDLQVRAIDRIGEYEWICEIP